MRPAPTHAPETGWSARLLGRFHLTGVFWYRFNRWLVTAMPDWLMAPMITLTAPLAYAVLVRIRRAIGANLAAALGPAGFLERQRRVLRTLRNCGMCLIERYERFSTDRPFAVEVEALEHWRAVADGGRGFVMVTAHLGLYEAGSMVPTAKEARRVHLVREPELDPRAQAFIAETARRSKARTTGCTSRPATRCRRSRWSRRSIAARSSRSRPTARTPAGRRWRPRCSAARFRCRPDPPCSPARRVCRCCPYSRCAKGGGASASCSARRSRWRAPATGVRIWMRRWDGWRARSSTRSGAPNQWFVFRELWPDR